MAPAGCHRHRHRHRFPTFPRADRGPGLPGSGPVWPGRLAAAAVLGPVVPRPPGSRRRLGPLV